jgi:hypothetical protein
MTAAHPPIRQASRRPASGVLQRRHIIAIEFRYCGKEIKRKLEQGRVDHEIDSKLNVYNCGRVSADLGMRRQLAQFSEREIAAATGVHRSRIRALRHGGRLTPRIYRKIEAFIAKRKLRIPGDKKFAFIFGGSYGRGLATCRIKSGWSAPMFVAIDSGSVGFQRS